MSCLHKMGYVLTFNNKCSSIYFGRKLVATTPLVNGLYMIDVSSCNLHVDVDLKKSKQSVNDPTSGIVDLSLLVMKDYKSFVEIHT